jgi:hypothetical protein
MVTNFVRMSNGETTQMEGTSFCTNNSILHNFSLTFVGTYYFFLVGWILDNMVINIQIMGIMKFLLQEQFS